MPDILTIGAYGWSESTFFPALRSAGIRTFCDIRRRRGVRGHEYTFANAARLEARLAALGIDYVHRLELSPSDDLRKAQAAADAKDHTARRKRDRLTPEFIAAFTSEVLATFDAKAFLDEFAGRDPLVLFCVERTPEACHRGLVARALAQAGAPVRHLTP